MLPKLGIVAGGGAIPGILVQTCRQSGRDFALAALKGHCDPALTEGVPHRWVRLGALGSAVRYLHSKDVRELVIVGSVVRPTVLGSAPDIYSLRFYLGVRGWRLGDGRLLNALIAMLESTEGFAVVGADAVEPDLLARPGPLGRGMPDAEASADIAMGCRGALALGAADRGQSVVVRAGGIIGREGRDGTDALLARCRNAPGTGGVLVKLPKPLQDRRIDLPTIGVGTVMGAAEAGLAGIAVEAGGALIVDRKAVAEAADRAGLFVVGLPQGEGS